MIIVVDGVNADQFTGLLSQVFELRARVFKDRLGWDVDVVDGQEKDHFDELHPTHIVSVTDEGRVAGCMRLLQTTGPNMLADVFSSILQGEPAPRSPLIWEATRFCVDTNMLDSGKTRNSISYVTSEVMVGAFEYARTAGVEDAVAVIDPIMNRVLKRSCNAPYDYLGEATPMGKVTAMAALMDCSETRINAVRDFANIQGDVFLDEDEAIQRFGDANSKASNPNAVRALQDYVHEQLQVASNTSELRAALHLLAELENDTNLTLTEGAATHS
ncbi:MAG: acyl-homoserine-lactone synthase [Planktotalea sp.]|uniref:acyl-homoserine-lactone synthase n=1 Tax=Planktotalea sp. TaxID=2029877 RepID=UPI003C7437EE